MLKIRQSHDCLFFNTGIPILGKDGLYIETRHCSWCYSAWTQQLGDPWWRHQMETFSTLLANCAGNSPRPVTGSFDIFFDLCLNKRLSKHSWGWWFETLSCPLWHHCNASLISLIIPSPKTILGTRLVNERWHYFVRSFLIGWAHT